ncbi:MAG: hypothetical protein ACOC46_03835, partial [Pirellulales bacterium]
VVVFAYRVPGVRDGRVYVYALPQNVFRVPVGPEPRQRLMTTQNLVTTTWREGEFAYVLVYSGRVEDLDALIGPASRPPLA